MRNDFERGDKYDRAHTLFPLGHGEKVAPGHATAGEEIRDATHITSGVKSDDQQGDQRYRDEEPVD